MSDVMFYGVLNMPYEMAMSDELSRLQFYGRVKEAVARLHKAETTVDELADLLQEVLIVYANENKEPGWVKRWMATKERVRTVIAKVKEEKQ